MNNIMKYSAITILILMFLIGLFTLSAPLVHGEKIFSNIFVDSYAPRKVLIIERNPIRIVMYGEFKDFLTGAGTVINLDDNSSSPFTRTDNLVRIIRELKDMEAVPTYGLNPQTLIDVDSKLTGDRNRGAVHSVTVTPTNVLPVLKEK